MLARPRSLQIYEHGESSPDSTTQGRKMTRRWWASMTDRPSNIDRSAYDNLPESALIALASLIVKRAKLRGIRATSRNKAIDIIRSIRPVPAFSKAAAAGR